MIKYTKINRLIEERYTIVPFSKARQPLIGKGKTAEVVKVPELLLLGWQRISVGLSQVFCEALSLAVITYSYMVAGIFGLWLYLELCIVH